MVLKNIKAKFIVSALFLLSLSSCGKIDTISSIKVPSIPDSNTSVSSEVESSSQKSSSSESSSQNSSDSSSEPENYIEVEDLAEYYYVGETLSDIHRLNVILHYNGEDRDISNRPSTFSFALKDSNGNDVDATKPFDKAGKYTFNLYATKMPEIVSNCIEITVKDTPKTKLTTKSQLPSGFTYYDFENSCQSNLSIPPSGNVNVLVIPVEVSDYPFKDVGYGDDYLDAIDTLFNGNGSADTNYWESISSYYKKSSLGKLNLNFEIAPTYVCGHPSADFIASGTGAAFSMAALAVDDYKQKNGSSSVAKFDNDKDGYIDGLWMVYSAPHYGTGAYGSSEGADVFWAFCSDLGSLKPNLPSPNVNSFGWASICFAYENTDFNRIDAHTFIHETGHLLSLPDYYSYDFTGGSASGAQGGLAMMDLNIGDQDSFSKISLGWADPYVPTGDCVVELKANESSGDCIILADNWNGTAFDEYLILDLVAPTGINALDSSEAYPGRPLYYSEAGIRMFHIDSRLGEFKYMTPSDSMSISFDGIYPVKDNDAPDYYLLDSKVKEVVAKGKLDTIDLTDSEPLNQRASGFTVINANSASRVMIPGEIYENNRLITLVGADGSHPEVDDKAGSNDSLFRVGDSWTVNGRTMRFFSGADATFNNGDGFSFVFSILECSNQSAKVQIRKLSK